MGIGIWMFFMPLPPDESGGYRYYAPFGAKKKSDIGELAIISAVIDCRHLP